jgi:hypothetical protein
MAKAKVGQIVRFKYNGKTTRGKVTKSLKTVVHVEQTAPKAGKGSKFTMSHSDYEIPAPRKPRAAAKPKASTSEAKTRIYRFTATGKSSKSPRAKYAIRAASAKEARDKLKKVMATAEKVAPKPKAKKKGGRKAAPKKTFYITAAGKVTDSKRAKHKIKAKNLQEAMKIFAQTHGKGVGGVEGKNILPGTHVGFVYKKGKSYAIFHGTVVDRKGFTVTVRNDKGTEKRTTNKMIVPYDAEGRKLLNNELKAKKAGAAGAGALARRGYVGFGDVGAEDEEFLPTVRTGRQGTVRRSVRGTVKEDWAGGDDDAMEWEDFKATVRVGNPGRRPRSARRRIRRPRW